MNFPPLSGGQSQFEANEDRARERAEQLKAQLATQTMLDGTPDAAGGAASTGGPLSALLERVRSALHWMRGD